MGSASILARSFPTVRKFSLRLAAVFAKRRRRAMGWRLVRPGKSRFHSLSVCVRKRLPTEIQTTNMSESCDSAWPVFWNQRYASGETPWTLHAVPAALCSFIKRRRRRGTVLIPGCGIDHEVLQFFQTAGLEVTAIDFSTVAVAQTRKALVNFDGKIIRGDFLQIRFRTAL